MKKPKLAQHLEPKVADASPVAAEAAPAATTSDVEVSIVQFVQAAGPGAHTTLIASAGWGIVETNIGLKVTNLKTQGRWFVPWGRVIWVGYS